MIDTPAPTTRPLDDERLRITLPPSGTGPRSRRHRHRRALLIAMLVVFVVAGVVLGVAGVTTVRHSTAGKRVDPTMDPDAPGFEAFVTPTPTLGMVHVHQGELQAVAVLVLGSGDAGGSVILVPPRLLNDFGAYGSHLLVDLYRDGIDGVRNGVQGALGIGLDEMTEVDDAQWASLVGTVAPIELTNPDSLVVDGMTFSPGPIALAPEQVGPFMRARVPGETELNRMLRIELLWEAWLAKLGDAGAAAVPGETSAGIGRFLSVLSAGQPTVDLLPVDEIAPQDGGTFVPRDDEVADIIAMHVPFPLAPAIGERPRVRLLNGTPDRALTETAAIALVRVAAEITILGNAESFDLAETEVTYYAPDMADDVRRLADALGGAEVSREPRAPAAADVIDVTVRLGADYLERQENGGGVGG